MTKLVKPSIKYKDSFIESLKESKAVGDFTEEEIKKIENNFQNLISDLKNEEKGINLKEGYVPCTTFWLVDGGEFIGRVSIRHKLTENLLKEGGHIGYGIRPSKRKMGYGSKILELALPEAKKIGIDKTLLTCNDENIGSAKIIEKNGGILQDKIEYHGKLQRRYWINIK